MVRRRMLQPLHPDMRQRLDPRYVEIHDRDLQYRPMRVFHPWQPGFRDQPSPLARYDGPRYPTTTLDIGIEGACNIRAYRSPGVTGFVPAIVWCAGSGMVLGDINSDASIISRLCHDLRCCVINVGYRRAPEHPYPTPFEDVFTVYEWIYNNQGWLGVNGTICLGGTSAGASLALSTLLARADMGLPLPGALIMVAPAQLDNTLTTKNFCEWRHMRHAPWAGAESALSFRQLYLPEGPNPPNWLQNPMIVPDKVLSSVKLPPTFCLTMECDLFQGEADLFCERLYENDQYVRKIAFPGLPHMALSMGQVFPEVYDKLRFIFQEIIDLDMKIFSGQSWPPQQK